MSLSSNTIKLRVQNLRRTADEMNVVLFKERIQATSVQELVYIFIPSLNKMKTQERRKEA